MQGVGFRYALRDEARTLGLCGWVRNCADGTVEALLQGEEEAIESLVAWARRAPRLAHVDQLSEAPVTPALDRLYSGFEIWPSA